MSGGKLRSDQFICPEKPKMVKNFLTTYMDVFSPKS